MLSQGKWSEDKFCEQFKIRTLKMITMVIKIWRLEGNCPPPPPPRTATGENLGTGEAKL